MRWPWLWAIDLVDTVERGITHDDLSSVAFLWHYPGVNTFGRGRLEELAMHPTVKPVALVADAIRDCSRRGDLVLDCFGGSGTTVVAAEQTGRRARVMELDPLYVDTTIERYLRLTGEPVVHRHSGQRFEELREQRRADAQEVEGAADAVGEVRNV